ncbi:MAG: hypothetical protein ABI263_06320 [Gelidibacter sp.]
MKQLYCRLFHHDNVVANDITKFVMEYTCLHCGKELTTSDQSDLIPLTDKRRETNKVLKTRYTIKELK